MSLYDVIDEITEQQIVKTDTGDTRIFGVMLGVVAKNYDKDMGGRVCVTIPTRDKDANELHWARMAQPSSGKKWGHYFLPEVGDQVLLAFEGGNIEKPFVIGCVPFDNNNFLTTSVDADNQFKRIVTKHGSKIVFEDSKADEEGKQDKITIQTAGAAHTVELSNADQCVRIVDKAKKNFIEIKTTEGAGEIVVQAESKLTIKVGDSIKVMLSGETGAVKISANEFKVEASKSVGLKTDGMLSQEGATLSLKASSAFKAESSGIVNISGSPIKIG